MKTGRPASARVSGEPARVASATATTLLSVIYARAIAQLRNCETDRKRQSLFRTGVLFCLSVVVYGVLP